MSDRFVAAVVKRRWLVLALTLVMAGIGLYNTLHLSIDAVPDITNVQVQINTAAPGYSPLEVEQRITFDIETALAGLPGLDHTRSLSRYGLSQVTAIFEDTTDIHFARQLVGERLQGVRGRLPAGLEPELGPIATGLGEIFMYSLAAENGSRTAGGAPWTLEELRTFQEWVIRPQLLQVRGVTEVDTIGGFERQFEIVPDAARLLAWNIGIGELVDAVERNNRDVGAGYIEHRGEQWLIRVPGQVGSLAAIGDIAIAGRENAVIRVRDVAEVRLGRELRTGAATRNGDEVVIGTAVMLIGENSREVARAVAARLADIGRSLPEGVRVEAVYDRTTLVDRAIATVTTNLFEGALLVIAVLFALLGNLRAALITALVIPLAMLFAITGMAANRVSGNLMSLGAIDFGLIVDGAVIVVENCLARLALAQRREGRLLGLDERLLEVTRATREVFRPGAFGVLIIMVVYLPVFALSGVEGKLFQPMAFTVVMALAGALVLSVTFVPAAVAVLVRGRVSHRDNPVMAAARRGYGVALSAALAHPRPVLGGAALLVLGTFVLATRLGSEFAPDLDEGDLALHALRIPGTSLSQSVAMQKTLEARLLDFPQVAEVFSKIGTAEAATDPMPPNVADTFVMLKPRSDWPDPGLPKHRLVAEMDAAVRQLPGSNYEFTQPIEMRFNELLSGVRADVAVRFHGDDLETLALLGKQGEALVDTIPGAADARLAQASGLPVLTVAPDREMLGRLGIDIATVQQTVRAAVSGEEAGVVFDGDRRFALRVRMPAATVRDLASLERLPIPLPGSGGAVNYVPLGDVATLSLAPGPSQIDRLQGKRYAVVTANVRGRDLGSFVAELQRRVADEIALPTGYWVDYGGAFEQLESASRRLAIVVPLSLCLVLALLYGAFGSARDALLIFSAVPLSVTGGVMALWLRGMPLSLSAGVGFIALSGIAVLNGVVMVSHIRTLLAEGQPLAQAVREGALRRLRPVLMTALVAGLGFVPMAFNTGIGSEVQRPLATVVVGGILSATLLTLVVLPALYRCLGGRS